MTTTLGVVLAALLISVWCSQANAAEVRIGYSVRDITPKAEDIRDGVRITGWAAAGPSKEVQKGDRLCVRAMAMRDRDDTLLVILTADILKFHSGDTYMLQEWFEKTFGIDRWHLIMNASHTHQSPDCWLFSKNPYAKTYHRVIYDAVKATITEAVANAVTPMVVKFARLQLREGMVVNKNRRLADRDPIFGAVDTDLPVFAFLDAQTGKTASLLLSVAAHPTCYAGIGGINSREGGPPVSSHAPGAVARAVKAAYGEDVVCMFAQGAGGDTQMAFPALAGKLEVKVLRGEEAGPSGRANGQVWTSGEKEGQFLTREEAMEALDTYAMLYVDIIKQGFSEGRFQTVEDIQLKTAGKEVKIPLAKDRPPPKTPLGVPNRTHWERPEGSVADYRKIIDDEQATEEEKNGAYEALSRIYDDERAAYSLFMSTVAFNDELRIAAMSNEVCYEIGLEIKEHYRQQGVETVFLGYSPLGTPYYPSNLQKAVGTYQGGWMHPPEGFDFDGFALDTFAKLVPK